MFDSLRQSLSNKNVSAGIEKLRQTGSESIYRMSNSASASTSTAPVLLPTDCQLDVNAGQHIIEHYKHEHTALRQQTETTMGVADVCSTRIRYVNRLVAERTNTYKAVKEKMKGVGDLVGQMESMGKTLADLKTIIDDVERGLSYLELVTDTQDMQEKTLNEKYKLALYRENKIAVMAQRKDEMNAAHNLAIEEKKAALELKQMDKLDVYGAAFKADLKLYKDTGIVANTLPYATSSTDRNSDNLSLATKVELMEKASERRVTQAVGKYMSNDVKGEDVHDVIPTDDVDNLNEFLDD